MNTHISFARVAICAAITLLISAIIVPAFAQSEERGYAKFSSNLQKVGQANQLYVNDFDDNWPLATVAVRMVDGRYNFHTGHAYPVPADVIDPNSMGNFWAQPDSRIAARSFWMNALTAYVSDLSEFENPVAIRSASQGDVFNPNSKIVYPGILLNGLLHTINSQSIEDPNLVPAFWHVQKKSLRGRCFSSPSLNCGVSAIGPGDCKFNPSGPPSSNLFHPIYAHGSIFVYDFTTTSWQFNRIMLVAMADTPVKPIRAGSRIHPDYVPRLEAHTEPFASVNENGVLISSWGGGPDCAQIPSAEWYPCFFRPDRTK